MKSVPVEMLTFPKKPYKLSKILSLFYTSFLTTSYLFPLCVIQLPTLQTTMKFKILIIRVVPLSLTESMPLTQPAIHTSTY